MSTEKFSAPSSTVSLSINHHSLARARLDSDLRMFNSKADQVEPFLREIDNTIALQRRHFPSDRDKTRYFSLYLADGIPTSWWTNIERSPDKQHFLENFKELVKEFKEHFDEPDCYAKALHKL